MEVLEEALAQFKMEMEGRGVDHANRYRLVPYDECAEAEPVEALASINTDFAETLGIDYGEEE